MVEVYRGVGQLLRRYTVGRLPKAFKIIPNLRNWEEVRSSPQIRKILRLRLGWARADLCGC